MGENGWSILLSWSNLLSPGVLCNLKEKCLFLFSKSLTLLLWKLFCLNVNIFHFQKSGQLCDSWEQYWTMRPLRRTTQSQKKNTRCLSNIALLNNVVMDPNCAIYIYTLFFQLRMHYHGEIHFLHSTVCKLHSRRTVFRNLSSWLHVW